MKFTNDDNGANKVKFGMPVRNVCSNGFMAEKQLRIEGYCEVVASDGEVITLSSNLNGVKTGYGYIGNPYYDCPETDPHWRWKDGDTVIECYADHPRAMPVGDAYQQLFDEREYEQQLWDDYMAEADAHFIEYHEQQSRGMYYQDDVDVLYAIQDELEQK